MRQSLGWRFLAVKLFLAGDPFGKNVHSFIRSAVSDQQIGQREIRVRFIGGDRTGRSVLFVQKRWDRRGHRLSAPQSFLSSLIMVGLYSCQHRIGDPRCQRIAALAACRSMRSRHETVSCFLCIAKKRTIVGLISISSSCEIAYDLVVMNKAVSSSSLTGASKVSALPTRVVVDASNSGSILRMYFRDGQRGLGGSVNALAFPADSARKSALSACIPGVGSVTLAMESEGEPVAWPRC